VRGVRFTILWEESELPFVGGVKVTVCRKFEIFSYWEESDSIIWEELNVQLLEEVRNYSLWEE